MASPKRTKKPASQQNPAWKGFINYDMTEDDKRAVKAIEFSSDDVLSWMDKVVDSGFKVTFSYDDYNHVNTCIGTHSDKEHPDYGILLTGRGSTPAKAFRQWLYIKDTVIGDDDWSSWLERGKTVEIDD